MCVGGDIGVYVEREVCYHVWGGVPLSRKLKVPPSVYDPFDFQYGKPRTYRTDQSDFLLTYIHNILVTKHVYFSITWSHVDHIQMVSCMLVYYNIITKRMTSRKTRVW